MTATEQLSGGKSARQLERERYRRRRSIRDGTVAAASTVVVFAVIIVLFVNAPGWPRVRETFFSLDALTGSLPQILSGFWLNVRMFLIGEVLVLAFGLLTALTRGLTGPAFLPLRLIATVYVDVFRGIPTLLVVFLLGFGMPALRLQGLPNDPVFWGVTALVLSYGAYVAEVYRAGIDSVHPSQMAAARSLGLSRGQAMRSVILPQAIRRVVPPLLNDFVSLQKDTALVAVLGPLEAVRQAQIYASSNFNYTPYVLAAAFFLALTIPLTRVYDRVAAREAARRGPGGPR
ncbi:MAG: amino acid ABC transporter permease [Streptosporangiales bacterium]